MLIRLGLKKLDNGNQFISVSINSSRVIVSIQYFRSQSHRQTLYVFCLPEGYQVRRLFTKSDDLCISMGKRPFSRPILLVEIFKISISPFKYSLEIITVPLHSLNNMKCRYEWAERRPYCRIYVPLVGYRNISGSHMPCLTNEL